MKLTDENYYSLEANRHYMSVSQYKDFLKCEAAAMAKLDGWKEPTQDALLLGTYVHSFLDGSTERLKQTTPELFTGKGELKAAYKHADVMIETVLNDDLCKQMLTGEHEVIVTAPLFGVVWKAKLDVLAPDMDRLADLKTVKSIREKYWKDGSWVSFVEAYDYTTQMAIYSELDRLHNKRFSRLEPFIVAVSKEEDPDKAVICFDDHTLDTELEKVSLNLPRVVAVKHGEEEAIRCEKCRYCRQTKKAGIVHYMNLLEGA